MKQQHVRRGRRPVILAFALIAVLVVALHVWGPEEYGCVMPHGQIGDAFSKYFHQIKFECDAEKIDSFS